MLIAFALVALETERGRQRREDGAERGRGVGQDCVRVRQRVTEREVRGQAQLITY